MSSINDANRLNPAAGQEFYQEKATELSNLQVFSDNACRNFTKKSWPKVYQLIQEMIRAVGECTDKPGLDAVNNKFILTAQKLVGQKEIVLMGSKEQIEEMVKDFFPNPLVINTEDIKSTKYKLSNSEPLRDSLLKELTGDIKSTKDKLSNSESLRDSLLKELDATRDNSHKKNI